MLMPRRQLPGRAGASGSRANLFAAISPVIPTVNRCGPSLAALLPPRLAALSNPAPAAPLLPSAAAVPSLPAAAPAEPCSAAAAAPACCCRDLRGAWPGDDVALAVA